MDFERPDEFDGGFDRDPPVDARDVAERTDLALEDDRIAPATPSASGPEDNNRPRHLSPSSSSVYNQCARKWKFRYRDRLPDPPGTAALAGTFAHRVLELLMQLPAEQRTTEQAKTLARTAWPETAADPDFQALSLDAEGERHFRWRGWTAIVGLWQLEDPQKVAVHATEHDVKVDIDGVPFRGIVDRIDVEADGLVIADYKSGKAPALRFSQDRLDQVLLYAAAVQAGTGQLPVRARLLYLGQRIIEVNATVQRMDAVRQSLGATWQSLTNDCDQDEFAPTTGPLCAWCPFAAECPDGQSEIRRRHQLGRVREDAPGLVAIGVGPRQDLAS